MFSGNVPYNITNSISSNGASCSVARTVSLTIDFNHSLKVTEIRNLTVLWKVLNPEYTVHLDAHQPMLHLCNDYLRYDLTKSLLNYFICCF